MSDATEAEVEAVARALAQLEPGEDWPTNSALGGGLTGARDDEYRSAMRDQAREAIAALDAVRGTTRLAAKVESLRQAAEAVGGVPRRSEAEIKAEAWDEAVRECHDLGWLHDFALSDALERNPYRAARVAGTTEETDQ